MSLAACKRMKIILAMRWNAAASKSAGNAGCLVASAAAPAAGSCGAAAGDEPDAARCSGCEDEPALEPKPPVPAPAVASRPVFGPLPAKRRISQRIATKATTASSISITKLARPSPMPRWLKRAASPRPAASPATGPSHDRLGAAAAAAPALAGAAAAAGVPGLLGWALLGVALGGVCAGCLSGALRCMPAGLPPPSRRASASIGVNATARPATSAAINQVFMVALLTELNHRRAAGAAAAAQQTASCSRHAILWANFGLARPRRTLPASRPRFPASRLAAVARSRIGPSCSKTPPCRLRGWSVARCRSSSAGSCPPVSASGWAACWARFWREQLAQAAPVVLTYSA